MCKEILTTFKNNTPPKIFPVQVCVFSLQSKRHFYKTKNLFVFSDNENAKSCFRAITLDTM